MEPLLLLPGMMCDARLFTPQINLLSAQRPVSVFPLTGADTIAAIASQIVAHAPPQFALAGLSMGGIVAMEIMRQVPGRVTRLALLDTNPSSEAPERAAARQPQIERVRAGGLRAVMRDEMKPHYLTEGPLRQPLLDLCMDMADALGEDVFEHQSRALQKRPDQSATLQRVTVPTLILCGEDDALCPVSVSYTHLTLPTICSV